MALEVEYTCPDGTPFPVIWPDPQMAEFGWRWDQMHHPTPLTPLASELWQDKRDGMGRAAETTGRYAKVEFVEANGYLFGRPIPPGAGELEYLSNVEARDNEQRLGQLLDLWEGLYRPEVEALTRSLRTWADPDDSLPDLVDRFDEVRVVSGRLGELHTVAFASTGLAAQRFVDFCIAEFGDAGSTLAVEAAAGLPNKSLESAGALWELSREALSRAAVADLLREHSPAEFLARLDQVDEGARFRAELDRFLESYGQRNESFTELIFPTWSEDPRFVVFMLKSYLDAPDERSPAVMHEATARQRIARTEEARALLDDDERFAAFQEAQRVAQQRTILLEDHNFYIDQRGHSTLRAPCLALGERLVRQGTIDQDDDVFYLRTAEIAEAAANAASQYHSLVAQRRSDRERWLRTLPPNKIGDGEVRLPPQLAAFVGPVEAEPSEPGEVKGAAASPGVVRGTVRVVRTLDEVEKLESGDVLVAYATAPPWTPLFAVAAAVVTDAGGPTSHAAIVAREFGIPAVVGTKAATARLEDGMVVTVDGDRGIVRIER